MASGRARSLVDWRLAVAVTVVLAVIGGYVLFRVLSGGGGSETLWREDFDGAAGSAPSDKVWMLTTGTGYPGGPAQWGTGELETYTADRANVSLDGQGHLKIVAARDAAGVWRSARLETRRTDFQAEPGGTLKVEARIQVPDGGPGYWPAFWMLGEEFRGNYQNWPGIGEIDIMEFKGSVPTAVNGTFHCGVAPGGPCKEFSGLGGMYTSPDGPLTAGFHTFAIEWDRSTSPEEIRWYADGEQFHTVRASQVDAATWAKATHHGFYVLLNLAIGGSYPGPPDASTRPTGTMMVDYVTVSRG